MKKTKLGMVVYAFIPSFQETATGRSLSLRLWFKQSEFQDSHGYTKKLLSWKKEEEEEKSAMVARACNRRTREVEAGKWRT